GRPDVDARAGDGEFSGSGVVVGPGAVRSGAVRSDAAGCRVAGSGSFRAGGFGLRVFRAWFPGPVRVEREHRAIRVERQHEPVWSGGLRLQPGSIWFRPDPDAIRA